MNTSRINVYVLCFLVFVVLFCMLFYSDDLRTMKYEYFYSNVTSMHHPQNLTTDKLILYYGTWFGLQWNRRIIDEEELEAVGCPFYNCKFTYDEQKYFHEADAIVFAPSELNNAYLLKRKKVSQRWIYVDVEPPNFQNLRIHDYYNNFDASGNSSVFNWTMTYHTSSEIVNSYGFFLPITNNTVRSLRPHLMDYDSETMRSYLEAYKSGTSVEPLYLPANRSRLAAWMSSHCPTESKREKIIAKLQTLIKIDTFGACGEEKCFPRLDKRCWELVLSPNYHFYFSMEHILCEEYVTEKAYYPYKYGLIPIVYGSANYSKVLPPHSYIDIRDHTPQSLADLLLQLQNDTVAYKKYHLWRKFWKVYLGSSGCELCYQLNINKDSKMYGNVAAKRIHDEKCVSPSHTSFFQEDLLPGG